MKICEQVKTEKYEQDPLPESKHRIRKNKSTLTKFKNKIVKTETPNTTEKKTVIPLESMQEPKR